MTLICEYCHSTRPIPSKTPIRRYRLVGSMLTYVLCEEHRARLKGEYEVVEERRSCVDCGGELREGEGHWQSRCGTCQGRKEMREA